MITEMSKKGKKRQYNPKAKGFRSEQKIQQPKDQSFEDGISITMDTYDYNVETGNRDRKTGRTTVRFPKGLGISDFYEQNRKIVFDKKQDSEL